MTVHSNHDLRYSSVTSGRINMKDLLNQKSHTVPRPGLTCNIVFINEEF